MKPPIKKKTSTSTKKTSAAKGSTKPAAVKPTAAKKKKAVSKSKGTVSKSKVSTKTSSIKHAGNQKTKTSISRSLKPKVSRRRAGSSKKKAPIRPPFVAYKGIRPYAFTSYAHKNMDEVFSIIKKLNRDRYRIWYDEGIEPGNEWPEIVGSAVVNCSQFLVFMSPYAADSRNVRNEINLAFSENKDIIMIFLQKTNLSEGMKLQIGTVQFINKFDLTDRDFYDKLTKVLPSTLRN